MLLWAMVLRNPWLLAVAIMSLLYSAGIAAWDEDRDLAARFGQSWRDYKGAVKGWRARWRPYHVGQPARLYIARTCCVCSEIRQWIEGSLSDRPRTDRRGDASRRLDPSPSLRPGGWDTCGRRRACVRTRSRALELCLGVLRIYLEAARGPSGLATPDGRFGLWSAIGFGDLRTASYRRQMSSSRS